MMLTCKRRETPRASTWTGSASRAKAGQPAGQQWRLGQAAPTRRECRRRQRRTNLAHTRRTELRQHIPPFGSTLSAASSAQALQRASIGPMLASHINGACKSVLRDFRAAAGIPKRCDPTVESISHESELAMLNYKQSFRGSGYESARQDAACQRVITPLPFKQGTGFQASPKRNQGITSLIHTFSYILSRDSRRTPGQSPRKGTFQ